MTPWAIQWDSVHVEARLTGLESRRVPDILLLRDGQPVAAVEIFVTHRVDEEKARVLADLGVPWLEVRADDVLGPSEDPGTNLSKNPMTPVWTAEQPLPVFREGPAGRWRCPTHQAKWDARNASNARYELEERERQRHSVEVKAVRVVDVLHMSGKHYRRIYRVEARRTDGALHTVALMVGDETIAEFPYAENGSKSTWDALRAACDDHLAALTRRGAAWDCAMPAGRQWITGALAAKVWGHVDDDPWARYPLRAHYPLRYRLNRRTGTWFIPADLRTLDWYRPPADPFEPHEARRRQQTRKAAPMNAPVAAPQRPGQHNVASLGPTQGTPSLDDNGVASNRGLGNRLHVTDLPWIVPRDAVIEMASYWACPLPPGATNIEIVIAAPRARAVEADIRAAEAVFSASNVVRVWLSPREDWPESLSDVPWMPLVLNASGEPALPWYAWKDGFAAFLEGLRAGRITVRDIIDLRARTLKPFDA